MIVQINVIKMLVHKRKFHNSLNNKEFNFSLLKLQLKKYREYLEPILFGRCLKRKMKKVSKRKDKLSYRKS
jgi:hypothetical protein